MHWDGAADRNRSTFQPAAGLCICAGTEPWGLYNVVLFLLHDRGGSGRVSLEEAMKITFLRVGKVSGGAGWWRSRAVGRHMGRAQGWRAAAAAWVLVIARQPHASIC